MKYTKNNRKELTEKNKKVDEYIIREYLPTTTNGSFFMVDKSKKRNPKKLYVMAFF